jgi:hypothetical protein
MTGKNHFLFYIFLFQCEINISHLYSGNSFMFFLVLIWLLRITGKESIFSEIVSGSTNKDLGDKDLLKFSFINNLLHGVNTLVRENDR